jgi:hypothetical protein
MAEGQVRRAFGATVHRLLDRRAHVPPRRVTDARRGGSLGRRPTLVGG